MDDFLLEAAAEVEAAHVKKKSSLNDDMDILLTAANAIEREYEEEGFDEDEDFNRTDISREDVKDILRKAARSVDNDDAADARDILEDVASSLQPAEGVKDLKKKDSSDDEGQNMAMRLNRAAEHVLDGKREYEVPMERESDPDSPTESEYEEINEEEDEEEREYKDNNLFMISCFKRDIDAVERHLERGANSMYRDRHGWTSLHWAAAKGFDDIAELLISRFSGTNLKKYVNSKDKITGWTPLHLACVGGHIDCISILLDNGAKKNVRNNMNETPWDCVGVSLRTPDGRRIAKLLGKWKKGEEPTVQEPPKDKEKENNTRL